MAQRIAKLKKRKEARADAENNPEANKDNDSDSEDDGMSNTQELRGNKPWALKLVVTIGSDIEIKDIVEENVIDMSQGGLLMEVKCLQVIHSKKGLLVAILPKNRDLAYI